MDNYVKWLEKEQEWIDQMAREAKASWIKADISVTPISIAFWVVMGLPSEGVSGIIPNILSGAIFGVFATIFGLFLMLILMPRPRKYYARTLEVYSKDLNLYEQEELGSQMLSADAWRIDFQGIDMAKQKIVKVEDI